MAKRRRKEKNCLTNDTRNYKRRIWRYLQLVELWNIERVYRTIARFTERMQGKGIWTPEITDDFEKKHLQTDEFVEHSRNSWKTRRKVTVWSSKLKITYTTMKTEKFAGLAHDVTPADCGLDFESISSPQSPAITARNTQTCNGVVGGQYRDCTGIRTGNDAS